MAEAGGFDIRRMGLIGGAVLVIVFAVLFFAFRSCAPAPKGQGYTVIYSNLDLKDAANVIARLKELAIPYEIREDGRAVAVPKEKSDQARIGLAEKNLPLGGAVGWEIFDQTRMGATDFDRRIQLIRAISGELSRTIRQIEGVADVRVQIVIPETKLFATTVVPVTASVLLSLRPGMELSRGKINGIVHLVSSSVENLQPENVTVVDDTGKILSANIPPTVEAIAMAPFPPPAERPVAVLAATREIVVVSPEVQAAKTATLEELGTMETAVKQKTTKEAIAAAPLKIAATFEVTKTASLSAEERVYLKAQAKKELERDLSGKAQELVNRFYPPNSIIVKVGVEILPAKEAEIRAKDLKLKRQEAIILVDNRIDLNPKLKQATFTTVAAAIAYDKKRGDKIILQLVPFHLAVPPVSAAAPVPVKTGFARITPIISLMGVLKWSLVVLAVLLAVWLAIFLVSRLRQEEVPEKEEARGPMVTAASPARERPPVLDQIRSQVEANPERIAELLKNWLSE